MSEGSKGCWRLSCDFLAAYKFEGCCLKIFAQLLTNFQPAAYKFSPSCWPNSSGLRSPRKIRQASKGSRSTSCDFLAAYKFNGCCLQIFANLVTNFRAAAYKFSACCLQISGLLLTNLTAYQNWMQTNIFIGERKVETVKLWAWKFGSKFGSKVPSKMECFKRTMHSKFMEVSIRFWILFSILHKYINRSAVLGPKPVPVPNIPREHLTMVTNSVITWLPVANLVQWKGPRRGLQSKGPRSVEKMARPGRKLWRKEEKNDLLSRNSELSFNYPSSMVWQGLPTAKWKSHLQQGIDNEWEANLEGGMTFVSSSRICKQQPQ